jgi:hypothetical protein
VFASARGRLTAFLAKLVDDAHATAILSIVEHEEQCATTSNSLAKAMASGE